ncbi:MAG: N-acetyl-alpha-D-glucosaminyl L-malate synthase BshA [Planctomycetota bacterium]|nr:N-acetyl-alpha-D-glucosaminyl L-malate synthase BshA [Planctomycetota bacterium]
MKIGVVCYPTFGGSGVVATELSRAIAKRGHEIHLFSYAPPARLDPFLDGVRLHEVEVSSYPLFKYPPYDLALSSRLAETVEEEDLDLVHVHYAIPHTVAALLVKTILHPRPLPVITTLHGTDITIVGQDPSYARVTRYALNNSDAITSVSDYLREETRRTFGVERTIEVIPNFVDTERFKPAERAGVRRCFAKGGERVLMHASNFRPVKRADLVVEAFARVAQDHPATLVMVGDGPERARCEARASELGVKERTRFLGSQADMEHLLPAADVYLLPSEYESFGLSALEAMACGVVPVVTNAGGLPEVVDDEQNGLLIDEAELGEMGARISALLADAERLAGMREAARQTAETRFGRDAIVDRYEALYESVLTPA